MSLTRVPGGAGPRYRAFLSFVQTGFHLVPPSFRDSSAGFAAHATDVWFSFNDTTGCVWPAAPSLLLGRRSQLLRLTL